MVFEVIIGRGKRDIEKYGKKGTVFIGKQYVKMGEVTSLSNPVYLDVASSHVVFVVGKRGGGKCVLGSTEINLGNKIKTIKEIYEDLEKDSLIVKKTEKEELLKLRKKLEILSFDENLKIIKRPVSFVYKKFIKEKIIKIKTKSGKEVFVTKEHPLLIPIKVKSGSSYLIQFLWQRADLIKENDDLVVYENNFIKKDEIKKIEKINYSGWVYDLTIPKTHNFIGNSVVCHNSYTMGVIAEGIADLEPEVKENLAVVLLDTMGVYWTMKYPNFQDAELLKEWGMEAKPLDVKIYTPAGFYKRFKEEGIPTDFPFSIRPIDVEPSDWCRSFEIDINSPEGVLLSKVVQALVKEGKSFEIDEIIAMVNDDEESERVVKAVVMNQFEKAKGWGIFSKEGTPLKDLVSGGQVTVLDVSPYATMAEGWAIKGLVVGLISKKLFNQRMIARKTEEFSTIDAAMHYFRKETEEKLEEPMVWLIIDELHELLPRGGKTAATDALVTILREGRQPGISLIGASQQPGKIHTDVMTQSDTVISHRLTAKVDVDALGQLMQSYMRKGLDEELNVLPAVKGSAVVFDDLNERLFPVQIRPRFTWHGGGAPIAIKERKEFLKKLKGLED